MVEKNKIVRYAICFFALTALCWLFPYTGDDWAWGSQIGLDRLNVWFEQYNGRYAGNLLVLLMTRSNVLKAVVMSFCLTGILFCIEDLVKKTWAFYIGAAALVLLPKLVLRQAVIWTSGFSNYAVPTFLILIYICYVYPLLGGRDERQRWLHALPMVVLGAVSTLFMENMTIYILAVAAATVVYVLFTRHCVYVQHLAYLLGAAIGTLYMFANSAYHVIASQGDEYRSIAKGGILHGMKENYLDVIYEEFFLDNIWLNLAIFIVCLLLYRELKEAGSRWNRVLMQCCLWVMAGYSIFAVFSSTGISTYAKQEILSYIEGAGTAVCLLALAVFSVFVGIYRQCLWKMLFWVVSQVCLVAPLFVVNPIGGRCFFVTYVMFAAYLCELCNQLCREEFQSALSGKNFGRACGCVACVGLAFYFCLFASVYVKDKERLAYVRNKAAEGEREIEVLHLPYESYIWTPTPAEEPWIKRYKLFYGLPEDIKFNDVWEYTEKKKEGK